MPSTLAGQLGIIVSALGIIGILVKAKRTYDQDKKVQADKLAAKDAEDKQHREWLELLILDYARHTGYRVSDELIKKHMRINGNANKSSEEKDRIYGKDRPKGPASSGEHDVAELAKGVGGDD